MLGVRVIVACTQDLNDTCERGEGSSQSSSVGESVCTGVMSVSAGKEVSVVGMVKG